MTTIDVNMIDAVKVQFLKPIFEDDFVDRGMKAWLTKIEKRDDMYDLYFDLTEFEQENDKYMTESFFMYGKMGKELGTAKEAGHYKNKTSFFFCTKDNGANDDTFSTDIAEYLQVIE